MKIRLFEEYSSGVRKISTVEFDNLLDTGKMDFFIEYEIGIISNLFDGAKYRYYFLRKDGWDVVGKEDNINYIKVEMDDNDIRLYKFEDEWFVITFLDFSRLNINRFLCDQFYSLVDTIEINK